MKKMEPSRPRGRPRSFDREEALDCAVMTFWAKGYSAATLDDLTESMGINRPSLYASFGNKHDLFMEVIDRYAVTFGHRPVNALFGETDIKKAVEAFLEASIACVAAKDQPRGCLMASVASEEAEKNEQVRDKLSAMFAETDRVITERVQAAQDAGQLPLDLNARTFAQMIVGITHSFATRARVGAGPEELSPLAEDFVAMLFPANSGLS